MTLSAPLSFYLANEKVNLQIAQLAMVVQFVYLFIKSTWQTEFFPDASTNDIKYKEGILKISDEVVSDYFKKLMLFMENEKPYLDEDCNIQTISIQTSIPVHHLSNILNQHFAKNFPDFINEYRISEAKMRLTSTKYNKITLEAIGYDCGFGSKSSFNKAFKKHTKLTPSKYRTDFQIKISSSILE
jgi:AraC-like DNA-binding protein